MGKKSKVAKFQVVLVGAKKVGKYSIREQYVKGWIAPRDFNAPPGSDSKVVVVEKKKYEVAPRVCGNLEDLEGPCDGIVLVYNISDESSIQYIKNTLFPELKNKFGKTKESTPENQENDRKESEENLLSVPTILVGNKADEGKLSRAASTESGENLAKELGCSGFYETSATCNENIPEVFSSLLTEMLQQRGPMDPGKEKKKSKCTIS